MSQFLGLRTAIYTAKHLAAAKDWYTAVLGFGPYFDEPYYVGFNIKGYELGIVPDESAEITRSAAGIAYWGVPNADAAWGRLIELGAAPVRTARGSRGQDRRRSRSVRQHPRRH